MWWKGHAWENRRGWKRKRYASIICTIMQQTEIKNNSFPSRANFTVKKIRQNYILFI